MAQVKLKKPKVAEAKVVGLSKATRTNGGTTAPPGPKKTQGLGNNNAINPSHPNYVPKPAGGNAGSTSSGGSTAPSTSPTSSAGPSETPGSIVGRAGTEAKHAESLKNAAYKKYLAALAYGDPKQINFWGNEATRLGATGISNVGEDKGNLGELLNIEKEEGKNQLANKFAHTGNNTFRSGFNLVDINNIGEAAQNAKAEAWTKLQNALAELDEAKNIANNEYAQEMGGWAEKDREAALESEPGGEDAPPDSGGDGGGGGGGNDDKKKKKQKQANAISKGNALRPGQAIGNSKKAK